VAFTSTASNLVPRDTNNVPDIFVHDRRFGATKRVSVSSAGAQANAGSGGPDCRPRTRFVAFGSFASNLILGDTNDTNDILVRGRLTW